jgi:hypothetical protein
MKENVGIAGYLPHRMLHGNDTSRRCAEGEELSAKTREITPPKSLLCSVSRPLACLAGVLNPRRNGSNEILQINGSVTACLKFGSAGSTCDLR